MLLIKLSHCQEIAVDLTDQNIIINTIYQIQQYFIITGLSTAEQTASSVTMQLQYTSFYSEQSANKNALMQKHNILNIRKITFHTYKIFITIKTDFITSAA